MHTVPTKVAHFLPWPEVSGVEMGTIRIAQATEGDEFHHILFCPGDETEVARHAARAGLEVENFDSDAILSIQVEAVRISERSFASDAESSGPRGSALVHSPDVNITPIAVPAGLLLRLPILCHVRNRYELILRHQRLFLGAVSKFVFISQATRDRFCFKHTSDRGRVIFNYCRAVRSESCAGRCGPAEA